MTAELVVAQQALIDQLVIERDLALAEVQRGRHKLSIANGDYDTLRGDFELLGMDLDAVKAELDKAAALLNELGIVLDRRGLAVPGVAS